jgi:hypothetical protein
MQQWHKKQIIYLTECNSGTSNQLYRSPNTTIAQKTNYISHLMQQWHNELIIYLTENNSGTTNKLYLSLNETLAQQTNYIAH